MFQWNPLSVPHESGLEICWQIPGLETLSAFRFGGHFVKIPFKHIVYFLLALQIFLHNTSWIYHKPILMLLLFFFFFLNTRNIEVGTHQYTINILTEEKMWDKIALSSQFQYFKIINNVLHFYIIYIKYII